MNRGLLRKAVMILVLSFLMACDRSTPSQTEPVVADIDVQAEADVAANQPNADRNANVERADRLLVPGAEQRLGIYATFPLTADLSHLSDNQKKMIPLLIEASKVMDDLFWLQAYGPKTPFLNQITDDKVRKFAEINYGPWDRLDGDKPFLNGFSNKPLGANFYPHDLSKNAFDQLDLADKVGLYSLLLRIPDSTDITVVPYHEAYKEYLDEAALLLNQASELAEDDGFKEYLKLRSQALITDNYQPSDLAWMDMKNNKIDVVIGAIETYEDQLFGYRAAYESYVLIKDLAWSKRLSRYASFLPELQRDLPVEDKYKSEVPGSDSDLNAYDVIYYAGHSNAGSKTIAINLPNDEEVQLKKGTRRLQLKNAMRAKFDRILVPISEQLIVPDQRKHITFNAFFGNTMFHEVAHGLGIKNTVNDTSQRVRVALKELASPTEEGKADVLGLYMVTKLFEKGEMPDGELMDHYVTFLASIFRSVRFGASSAHGKANMVRFNFFKQQGAFSRNTDGQYRVDFDRMQQAMDQLSRKILMLQGDGDYSGTKEMLNTLGTVGSDLAADLARLSQAGIPVDIVFDQGLHQLDL